MNDCSPPLVADAAYSDLDLDQQLVCERVTQHKKSESSYLAKISILWQDVRVGLLGCGGYTSWRRELLWLVVLFLCGEEVAAGGMRWKIVVSRSKDIGCRS